VFNTLFVKLLVRMKNNIKINREQQMYNFSGPGESLVDLAIEGW